DRAGKLAVTLRDSQIAQDRIANPGDPIYLFDGGSSHGNTANFRFFRSAPTVMRLSRPGKINSARARHGKKSQPMAFFCGKSCIEPTSTQHLGLGGDPNDFPCSGLSLRDS